MKNNKPIPPAPSLQQQALAYAVEQRRYYDAVIHAVAAEAWARRMRERAAENKQIHGQETTG